MLTLLINRAKASDDVHGVVPHLIDGGLSILQYTDDTILFIYHNLEQAQNMKNILCAFEQLSGLKINLHKSEIFCFGEAENYENHYMELFGCNSGNFPIRYLGIPIHYRKLSNNDWVRIQERFEQRLSSWKGKNFFNWRQRHSSIRSLAAFPCT
jgi:mannosylglycoprotein endo-beta-mannosidase